MVPLALLLAASIGDPIPAPAPLLGDFATPDAVVVVFTDTWGDTWRALVDAIPPPVRIVVARERRTEATAMEAAISALDPAVADRLVALDGPVDTPWIRDFGPLQTRVADGPHWIDTKYSPLRHDDDQVPRRLGRSQGVEVTSFPFGIEGGALASNGTGLCVMTTDFHGQRLQADGFDAADVGCRALVLTPALREEPTMHTDVFLQFVSETHVVLAEADDATDPVNARRLGIARQELQLAAAELGIELQITRVPLPTPTPDGRYRSYAGFVQVGPGVVAVPSYAGVDPTVEATAHAALRRAMPDRTHVPIPADLLAEYHGSPHCVALGLALAADSSPGKVTRRRRARSSRGRARAPRRSTRSAE